MMCFLMLALSAGQAPRVEVTPTGPVRTIGRALELVGDWGEVLIRPGVYREPTVVVRKPVSLLADSGAVLEGEHRGQLLVISANDVTIRGLTLRGVGARMQDDFSAIRVADARGCVLDRNIIEDGYFGIYLARVSGCRITGNRLSANRPSESLSGNGIHLWSSDSVFIAGNHIAGFRDGIYFEFVHHSDIRNNVSTRNLRYGLHFMYSDDCRYTGNLFQANGSGVAVMFTRGVEMVRNQFLDNWGAAAYGLLLKEIDRSRLTDNRFRGNTVALLVEGGNGLEARGNSFAGNGWGVRLSASTQDARFEGNSFSGNSFDVATNSRTTSAVFAGNFWEGYRGYDLDHNGLGDVPYRPVGLFSVVVEHNGPALLMLQSLFVRLLDAAERAVPSLTPAGLADATPLMRRPDAEIVVP